MGKYRINVPLKLQSDKLHLFKQHLKAVLFERIIVGQRESLLIGGNFSQ